MSLINILPSHVADLIAAGEVIERPASVIKELLENSIDAGARNVTAELRDGGLTYIRVSDDGCGMSPEDAGIAFLRHATGKLRDERGLEAISTLGFRGEALAAVSACSKIELITRLAGPASGCRVILEAGDRIDMAPCGSPEGTVMTVRDLFYNTPARLKFIKSERAESAACINFALRCALGRPEISVRCVKDGNDEFFSPGNGDALSCVYSLLGREFSNSLLRCETERDDVRVSGFVSSPACCRGSRDRQFFFCNGRGIASNLIRAALEQAYKNSLPKGRFPACVLYVEISLGTVDVNVHPTKAEVRFSDERKVFDGVYYAALAALESERPGGIAFAEPAAAPPPAKGSPPHLPASSGQNFPGKAADDYAGFAGTGVKEKIAPYNSPRPEKNRDDPEKPGVDAGPEQLHFDRAFDGVEIIGEAFGVYIVAQSGDELIFADKHAAHERMIFDRLKTEGRDIPAQALISPLVVRADAGKVELTEKYTDILGGLGFEIDPFGEKDLIIRALPSGTDESDAQSLLDEIFEKLETAGTDCSDLKDDLLRAVACGAAIKAKSASSEGELAELIQRVMSGEIKYCPHGRPLCFCMSKKDVDKKFKRIT